MIVLKQKYYLFIELIFNWIKCNDIWPFKEFTSWMICMHTEIVRVILNMAACAWEKRENNTENGFPYINIHTYIFVQHAQDHIHSHDTSRTRISVF